MSISFSDKRLFEVRKEFVERVSSGVLSQLLDDLLEKGVLNEEEVENVRVISSKQGKARVLIDKGRNKGPKASLIFIECINCRDSYLADNLGLQAFLSGMCDSPAHPNLQPMHSSIDTVQNQVKSKSGVPYAVRHSLG